MLSEETDSFELSYGINHGGKKIRYFNFFTRPATSSFYLWQAVPVVFKKFLCRGDFFCLLFCVGDKKVNRNAGERYDIMACVLEEALGKTSVLRIRWLADKLKLGIQVKCEAFTSTLKIKNGFRVFARNDI